MKPSGAKLETATASDVIVHKGQPSQIEETATVQFKKEADNECREANKTTHGDANKE